MICRLFSLRVAPTILALSLLIGTGLAQTVIRWAGTTANTTGSVISPAALLAPPDGSLCNFFGGIGQSDYLDFGEPVTNVVHYSTAGLANLLGVSVAVVEQADFIVFEQNATPFSHFESCDWLFDDGVNPTKSLSHSFTTPSLTFPVMSVAGISASDYANFFNIPGPLGLEFQALLFDLPSIDVKSTEFRVTLSAVGTGTSSPDPDAMGVLCHNQHLPVCCPPIFQSGPYAGLGAANVGVNAVVQIFGVPDDLANEYYMTLTVRKVPFGDYDALSGKWNCVTNDWTPYTHVDAFNSPGNEVQCSISWNRLVAVCDSPAGVLISSRVLVSDNFPAPVLLLGLPPGYLDPQLTMIDGQLVIYFKDLSSGNLRCGDVDPNVPEVTNISDAVIIPPGSGVSSFHSPTPIPDVNGECRHLIFAANSGGNSDAWYQSYPKPVIKPPCRLYDDGSHYLNNPFAIAGEAWYGHDASGAFTWNDPLHLEYFAVSSDVVPHYVSSIAEFVLHRPKNSPPALALIAFGPPGPIIPISPLCGPLCIDPQIVVFAGVVQSELIYSLPVGPLPAPVSICGQAALLDFPGPVICLSNSFVLELR